MRRLPTVIAPSLLGAVLPAGCQEYRIVHHQRPAYYAELSDAPLPDRVEMPDGSVAVYHTKSYGREETDSTGDEDKRFKPREELEDGTIVLRALLPEHVVGNTLECIRNEEYELLWDQMLSEQTKMAYEEEGKSKEDFIAFFREHRVELARTLNRMVIEFATHQVVVESDENGLLVCRFWPQVAQHFKFRYVAMMYEGFGLKLALIY